MFLARIDGTLTSTVKHETLEGCRFLIGQRLDADGGAIGDPLVLVDTLGAGRGTTVLVTTDNETLRTRVGKTTPARMVVCGLVDETRDSQVAASAVSPTAKTHRTRLPADRAARNSQ
jgi:ethanolamine utilization protein EutN